MSDATEQNPPADENAAGSAAPAAPKSGGRWRRRLMKTGLVLVVLLLLLPFALKIGPVRDWVAGKIGTALNREVTIDSAFAYWFHGIDLEGVSVKNAEGFEGNLATIDKVHVDVGLFGLIGGNVDAEVEIENPVVHLTRTADGTNNLAGIGDATGDAKKPVKDKTAGTKDGGDLRFRLEVREGAVHAHMPSREAPTTLQIVKLVLTMDEDELALASQAKAKDAAVGDGDAHITASLTQDASGLQALAFQTTPIDLSRIAPLLTSSGVLKSLRGTLEGGARAEGLAAGQPLEGALSGKRVAGTLTNGAAFSIDGLTVALGGTKADARTTFTVDVDATGAAYEIPGEDGTRRFREAKVEVDATGTFDRDANRIVLESATVDAGPALKLEATKPWMIALGEKKTAQGSATLRTDFARLGSVATLSTYLERLRRGQLVAAINARQGDGLDLSAGARIVDLVMAPATPGGPVFQERNLSLQARFMQHGDARRIDLYTLESDLARSQGTSMQKPLILRLRPGSMVLNGPLGIQVDARRLSTLLPDQLNLAAGEVIDGTITVTGTARGTPEKGVLDAEVSSAGLRLPRSWDASGRPSPLKARVRADMAEADLRLALSQLQGFGIQKGTGSARFVTVDGTSTLGDSQLDLVGELSTLRPWLAAPLGLDPQARIAGTATVQVKTVEARGGLQVSGRTHVDRLFWQRNATATPLSNTTLSLLHDVWVAPDGEPSTMKQLVVATNGLTVDLSGSAFTSQEGATDLDVKGTLRGDATRFAPTLAALLGPDYADLRGTGAIAGTVTATGNPADRGADLLVDVSLTGGTWLTGGLSIAEARITARRAALEDPLTAVIDATFNRGPTRVIATVVPGPGPMSPTLDLSASQVDTSTLLVDQGPGRFLAYALPSLLPTDANVPVLSGLLDAKVTVRAADIGAPALGNSLAGQGRIAMTQGEIKNSTLFRGAGGGGQLGKAMSALAVAVPEVGQVMKSITRALTFQTLESEFTVGARRVNLTRTHLAGRYVTIDSQGVVTFEKQVDVKSRVRFEGSAGKKVKKVLPDQTVPMRVTGILPDAQVVPDLDLAKLAGGSLVDKAKDLIKGKKPKDVIKDLKDLIK